MKLLHRVQNLLYERGEVFQQLTDGCGVGARTLYRKSGVVSRSTIAALAYHFGITAEELVAGTDVEEVWRNFEPYQPPSFQKRSLTVNGETKSLMEWCSLTGISYNTVYGWIKCHGVEEAERRIAQRVM